jgi:predicted RNase H-like HicB family nuclease
MLTDYVNAAMRHAEYERLEDDTWYGEIPELQGVFANAPTLEACREQLRSVLEGWIALGYHLGHTLPVVDGIDINIHPAVTT